MEGPFKRKKKEEPMNMIGKNRRRGRLEDKTENSGKKRTEEEARLYAESHFLQEDQESNSGKNDQLTKEDILKIRQILEAEDGEKALEVFEENRNKISLILLDVMMPKLDGWSVLRQIRQLKNQQPSGDDKEDAELIDKIKQLLDEFN